MSIRKILPADSHGRPTRWEIQHPEENDIAGAMHKGQNRFVIAGRRRKGPDCGQYWNEELGLDVASYSVYSDTLKTAINRYPSWLPTAFNAKGKPTEWERNPEPGEMLAIRILAAATLDVNGDEPCWQEINFLWWDWN